MNAEWMQKTYKSCDKVTKKDGFHRWLCSVIRLAQTGLSQDNNNTCRVKYNNHSWFPYVRLCPQFIWQFKDPFNEGKEYQGIKTVGTFEFENTRSDVKH